MKNQTETKKKVMILQRNLEELERDFKTGLVEKHSYKVRKQDVTKALRIYKKGINKMKFI